MDCSQRRQTVWAALDIRAKVTSLLISRGLYSKPYGKARKKSASVLRFHPWRVANLISELDTAGTDDVAFDLVGIDVISNLIDKDPIIETWLDVIALNPYDCCRMVVKQFAAVELMVSVILKNYAPSCVQRCQFHPALGGLAEERFHVGGCRRNVTGIFSGSDG